MSALSIKSLNYTYADAAVQSLSDVELHVPEGEFVLIIGGSGSGKSTLLRAIKGLIPHFHGGKLSGSIEMEGRFIESMTAYERAAHIGMVFQNPEDQVVMSRVEDEMAFGLENIGTDERVMKRRLMEVADALGLTPILEMPTSELSGGQLQKTALASILAMQPRLLLLDEPTSQLDPFAGEDLLTLAKRLNEDNGMTVILVEQRLERCIHLADRLIYMEDGRIVFNTTDLQEGLRYLTKHNCPPIHPVGLAFANAGNDVIPLTVKDGRRQLVQMGFVKEESSGIVERKPIEIIARGKSVAESDANFDSKVLVDFKRVSFSYTQARELLKGIDVRIEPGQFTAILGENGAGKSTLLKLIAGVLKGGKGIQRLGDQHYKDLKLETIARSVGYLSQSPSDYLFSETVRDEVMFTLKQHGLPFDDATQTLIETLGLTSHLDRHPRDLSTGERQRVAIAAVMALKPKVLLLDEPTRGLDYLGKARLGNYLKRQTDSGMAVVMITHDIEFAAEYANHIWLMSKGEWVAKGTKHDILSDAVFYASQMSKLFKHYDGNVVTVEEGVQRLRLHQKEKKHAINE